MLKFFTKKINGSISLFLVLIMLPMFTLAGLIVDGARISAARTAVSGAGDLALNSALSEYDKVLHDVYGLFAVSENMDELQKNVERYFNNTINNSGVLEGSDSYTRSFINSIGSMFSSDDISFDNIVDTEVEPNSFKLYPVDNSALANPNVLERQIVEYMKYRGPVNLGVGLLTKLGCIGETSKQNKVIEAKVEYEKKLDTVQDACKAAYKDIENYIRVLTFEPHDVVKGDFKGDYLTEINDDVKTAREKLFAMTKRFLAVKSPTFQPGDIEVDKQLKKEIEQKVNNSGADDKNVWAIEEIKKYITEKDGLTYVYNKQTKKAEAKDEDKSVLCFFRKQYGWDNGSFDFLAQMSLAQFLHAEEEFEGQKFSVKSYFQEMYTYLNMLALYYAKAIASDTINANVKEQFVAEADAYAAMCASWKMIYTRAASTSTTWVTGEQDWHPLWKSQGNSYGKEAKELIYNKWYVYVSDMNNYLGDAIEDLNTVLDKIDELNEARTDYRDKVDDLSESEIKVSMKGDYENTAKTINKAAVNDLINILTENKAHVSHIVGALESIKYYNVDFTTGIAGIGDDDYFTKFSEIPTTEFEDAGEVGGYADALIYEKFVPQNFDVKVGLEPTTLKEINEDIQFYKFLKNTCKDEGEETEERKTEKATQKENRKKLIEIANKSPNQDTSNSGVTLGKITEVSGISSETLVAIAKLASEGFNDNTFDPSGEIKKDGDDDKGRASTGKSKLSQMSTLLEDLGNIATTARDYVYLEEYFTEMFSCYVTGTKDYFPTKSLNNQEMNKNKLYRSEVEYILWGNDDIQANINSTTALIFGIRFALNAIFAFTDSTTRTPALTAATAIAGWTGFGVPIVQTVILLVWALAESIYDVQMLCDGENIVIYKSKDTWMLGWGGVKQIAKETACKAVDDIFGKIQEVATDKISEVGDDIKGYAQKTIKGVEESVKSTIMNSLESLIVSVVGESNYSLTKDDIGARVDKAIDDLEASIPSEGVTRTAFQLGIGALRGQRGTIVDTLYGAYTKAKDGLATEASKKVDELLTTVTGPIEEAINGAVDSAVDALNQKVQGIIQEGGEMAKEKLNDAVDGFLGGLTGDESKKTVVGASSLTLNYKEYLKAFVLLNIVVNKDSMLSRCAKLIQMNVSIQNGSFDISKAYTMAKITGTISIRTTFFDIPVSTGVNADGDPIYELNFENIGTGRQKINYTGILGY